MPTESFTVVRAILAQQDPFPRARVIPDHLLAEIDNRVMPIPASHSVHVNASRRTRKSRRVIAGSIVATAVILGGTQLVTGSGLLPEFWKFSLEHLQCDVNGAGAVKVATLRLDDGRTAEYWVARQGDRVADIAFFTDPPTSTTKEPAHGPSSIACDPKGRRVDTPEIGFTSLSLDTGPADVLFYGWIPSSVSAARIEFSNGWIVVLRPGSNGYVLEFASEPSGEALVMVRQELVDATGATRFVRDLTKDNSKWKETTP